jgi:hypothetical protein
MGISQFLMDATREKCPTGKTISADGDFDTSGGQRADRAQCNSVIGAASGSN